MTLPRRSAEDVATRQVEPFSEEVLEAIRPIIDDVKRRGEEALRHYTVQFNERKADDPLYLDQAALRHGLEALPNAARARLERTAGRIETFARAQREAIAPVTVSVPGGSAGHFVEPVRRAGCYAPGGRYPLPSSALMTAVTARVAGVESVWVASPRLTPITIAAVAAAGADGLLVAGGAHAIAALTFGVGPVPPSDIVVGPGNKYVTAAKQLLSSFVAIDTRAGPSELVVVGDAGTNPSLAAADLLAQAEHDPDALPVLVTTDSSLVGRVEAALDAQLENLPTANVARVALNHGGAVVCSSRDEVIDACNRIAPEHLQLSVSDPYAFLPGLEHYGAVFLGEGMGEVLGDYGAGPNHVLPTGRAARYSGGLSVFNFLRIRTWMSSGPGEPRGEFLEDVAWLARQEGLEAHARAAEARR